MIMPVVMTRPTPGIEEPKPLDNQPSAEVLQATIMRRYGMLEPTITGPHFFQQCASAWWNTIQDIIDMYWYTTQVDYNPIENYDKTETYHTDDHSNRNEKGNSTSKEDNITDTETNSNSTTENQVSAFNSSDYQPDSKSENTEHATVNMTQDNSGNVNTEVNNNDYFTHDAKNRIHGNIGVTTTQKMIEEARRVGRFNFYEVVARMFAEEFLIMVW